MSAHTPGPWRYDPDPLPCVWSETKIEQGSQLRKDIVRVADVRGWGGLQYREDGAEMQDANGRLLAAAPDMLEAMLWALAELEAGRVEDAAELLREAIAKVEGGAR